jgi:hypothetical protein
MCVTVSSICKNHHYGSANMVAKKERRKEKKKKKIYEESVVKDYSVLTRHKRSAGCMYDVFLEEHHDVMKQTDGIFEVY